MKSTSTIQEFWTTWWDDDQRETIRVGKWRTAYMTKHAWICIQDGALFPDPDAKFTTLQKAIDWMVEWAIKIQTLTRDEALATTRRAHSNILRIVRAWAAYGATVEAQLAAASTEVARLTTTQTIEEDRNNGKPV